MLEKAVSICDAKYGNIYRWDGEFLHLLAAHDTPPALAEFRRRSALRPSLIRRMVETKTAIHVIDVAADPEYLERRTPSTVAAVELGGVRSFLSVPMLKENELIGSFSLYRQRSAPSPTSRSSWSRPSPIRPSSPSRMRGCSANCANPCSSRLRRLTCSR